MPGQVNLPNHGGVYTPPAPPQPAHAWYTPGRPTGPVQGAAGPHFFTPARPNVVGALPPPPAPSPVSAARPNVVGALPPAPQAPSLGQVARAGAPKGGQGNSAAWDAFINQIKQGLNGLSGSQAQLNPQTNLRPQSPSGEQIDWGKVLGVGATAALPGPTALAQAAKGISDLVTNKDNAQQKLGQGLSSTTGQLTVAPAAVRLGQIPENINKPLTEAEAQSSNQAPPSTDPNSIYNADPYGVGPSKPLQAGDEASGLTKAGRALAEIPSATMALLGEPYNQLTARYVGAGMELHQVAGDAYDRSLQQSGLSDEQIAQVKTAEQQNNINGLPQNLKDAVAVARANQLKAVTASAADAALNGRAYFETNAPLWLQVGLPFVADPLMIASELTHESRDVTLASKVADSMVIKAGDGADVLGSIKNGTLFDAASNVQTNLMKILGPRTPETNAALLAENAKTFIQKFVEGKDSAQTAEIYDMLGKSVSGDATWLETAKKYGMEPRAVGAEEAARLSKVGIKVGDILSPVESQFGQATGLVLNKLNGDGGVPKLLDTIQAGFEPGASKELQKAGDLASQQLLRKFVNASSDVVGVTKPNAVIDAVAKGWSEYQGLYSRLQLFSPGRTVRDALTSITDAVADGTLNAYKPGWLENEWGAIPAGAHRGAGMGGLEQGGAIGKALQKMGPVGEFASKLSPTTLANVKEDYFAQMAIKHGIDWVMDNIWQGKKILPTEMVTDIASHAGPEVADRFVGSLSGIVRQDQIDSLVANVLGQENWRNIPEEYAVKFRQNGVYDNIAKTLQEADSPEAFKASMVDYEKNVIQKAVGKDPSILPPNKPFEDALRKELTSRGLSGSELDKAVADEIAKSNAARGPKVIAQSTAEDTIQALTDPAKKQEWLTKWNDNQSKWDTEQSKVAAQVAALRRDAKLGNTSWNDFQTQSTKLWTDVTQKEIASWNDLREGVDAETGTPHLPKDVVDALTAQKPPQTPIPAEAAPVITPKPTAPLTMQEKLARADSIKANATPEEAAQLKSLSQAETVAPLDITKVPRSQLPDVMSREIEFTAKRMKEELDMGESPLTLKYPDPNGNGYTDKFNRTQSTNPQWMQDYLAEYSSSKKKIYGALDKIIADKGSDKGLTVERLKQIMRDQMTEVDPLTGEPPNPEIIKMLQAQSGEAAQADRAQQMRALEDSIYQRVQNKPKPTLPPLTDNFRKPLSTYANKFYRETSIENAMNFIDKNTMASTDQVYLANSENMALGQGKNKGIMLEFDPKGLEGQVNKDKPGWELAYKNGEAEFKATYNKQNDFRDSLKAITVKPDAVSSKGFSNRLKGVLSDLESQGWVKKTLEDGSIHYEKPEGFVEAPKLNPNANPYATGVDPILAQQSGLASDIKDLRNFRDQTLTDWGTKYGDLTPEATAAIQKAATLAKGRLAETRLIAEQMGNTVRDMVYFNYGDKRNVDAALRMTHAYPFWYTREAAKWGRIAFENPHMLFALQNAHDQVRKLNASMPPWMQDMTNIAMGEGALLSMPIFSNIDPTNSMRGNQSFTDPVISQDPAGQVYQALNNYGPGSTHRGIADILGVLAAQQGKPDLAYAYASRISSATTLANSLGLPPAEQALRLMPQYDMMFTHASGGDIFVGTKWDRQAVNKELVDMVKTGKLSPELAQQTAVIVADPFNTKYANNPEYAQAWQIFRQAVQNRRDQRLFTTMPDGSTVPGPTLSAWLGGPAFRFRTGSEVEIMKSQEAYAAIRNQKDSLSPEDYKAAQRKFWADPANQSYSLYNLLNKKGTDLDEAYAWSVLSRIGPGRVNDAYLTASGMDSKLLAAFYGNGGTLPTNGADYDKFMGAIKTLGANLELPDLATANEWSTASKARGEIYNQLTSKFGQATVDKMDNYIYGNLTKAQADAYLAANPEVQDALNFQAQSVLSNKLVASYYATDGLIKKDLYDKFYTKNANAKNIVDVYDSLVNLGKTDDIAKTQASQYRKENKPIIDQYYKDIKLFKAGIPDALEKFRANLPDVTTPTIRPDAAQTSSFNQSLSAQQLATQTANQGSETPPSSSADEQAQALVDQNRAKIQAETDAKVATAGYVNTDNRDAYNTVLYDNIWKAAKQDPKQAEAMFKTVHPEGWQVYPGLNDENELIKYMGGSDMLREAILKDPGNDWTNVVAFVRTLTPEQIAQLKVDIPDIDLVFQKAQKFQLGPSEEARANIVGVTVGFDIDGGITISKMSNKAYEKGLAGYGGSGGGYSAKKLDTSKVDWHKYYGGQGAPLPGHPRDNSHMKGVYVTLKNRTRVFRPERPKVRDNYNGGGGGNTQPVQTVNNAPDTSGLPPGLRVELSDYFAQTAQGRQVYLSRYPDLALYLSRLSPEQIAALSSSMGGQANPPSPATTTGRGQGMTTLRVYKPRSGRSGL